MIITENWVFSATQNERQSHLNLDESCVERGGCSTNHKGVLALFLDSTIPHGSKIHLCHACHNSKCSNPRHLYWGTASENLRDKYNGPNGERERNLIRTRKLGLKMEDDIKKKISQKLSGRRLSDDTKKKISESVKKSLSQTRIRGR